MRNTLLDTNIIVFLLEGNKEVASYLANNDFLLSVVSEIEIKSKSQQTKETKNLIQDFTDGTTIIQTNPSISKIAAQFIQSYNIKLPDAIIAPTAKYYGIPLATADAVLFKIKEIEIIKFRRQS